ncbi:MAG: hypothetical protein QME52_13055, partial [Bacteroidota bacterium]|nr:hypothetical protein [Bacteroidota bacterium]
YTYRAELLTDDGKLIHRSEPIDVITLDTTSHNFVWQIDTLGDGSSSVLYDVAIINDTLVYAVGEIYKRDSTGQFETEFYNIAKWNGSTWKLERIYYPYQGQNYIAPLHSIYAFSKNDIWVGSNQPMHWNGSKWRTFDLTSSVWNGWINKIWGTNSSNIYIVGNSGELTHFNGVSWWRLKSGTDQTINDVWGVQDPKTNEPFILAGASNIVNTGIIKLLNIKPSGFVDTLPWGFWNRRISSVWFQNSKRLFTAGGGVFNRLPNKRWREFTELPLIYTSRIRGQAINDIFVAGHFGLVAHWNGINWRVYPQEPSAVYRSSNYKNNLMVAVGYNINSRAIILMMRRKEMR